MKLTEVILNSLQISGNKTGSGLLIESSDLPEYVDNKATGKIIGRRETIVFPDNKYTKEIVKISNLDNAITNEEIQAAGGSIPVIVKGLTGKIYRTTSGEYAFSFSGDALERVKQ